MLTALRFLSFAALTFGTLSVATGCGKKTIDNGDAGMAGASALTPEEERIGREACCLLGAVCHGVDDEARAGECHDIGHEGDPATCLDELESCVAVCTDLASHVDGGVEAVRHACAEEEGDGGESLMDDHAEGGASHTDEHAGGAHAD